MQEVETAAALRKAGAGSQAQEAVDAARAIAAARSARTGVAVEAEDLLRRLKMERKAVADQLGMVSR